MLVECLSVGRAISLPATSTGGAKLASLATGAYSRIRKQFGLPIAHMEGIEEPLARLVESAYLLEAARCRLEAAGQIEHADQLEELAGQLERLYAGAYRESQQLDQMVDQVIRGIMDIKLDIEHKLKHGLNSSCASHDFEVRENVVTATFNQMSLVENQLHHILRRKALASALARKPNDTDSLLRLTMALHRYLNKSDQGHEELRQAVREAEQGDPDLDHLYDPSRAFLNELEDVPDRKAIESSLVLLDDITGALSFAGMERESHVVALCRTWLEAASKAGEVREDEAFGYFAEAFVQLELHLQRSVMDPFEDTTHLLTLAEHRADELQVFIPGLSIGAEAAVRLARFAPARDRPLVAPEVERERPYGALALLAVGARVADRRRVPGRA